MFACIPLGRSVSAGIGSQRRCQRAVMMCYDCGWVQTAGCRTAMENELYNHLAKTNASASPHSSVFRNNKKALAFGLPPPLPSRGAQSLPPDGTRLYCCIRRVPRLGAWARISKVGCHCASGCPWESTVLPVLYVTGSLGDIFCLHEVNGHAFLGQDNRRKEEQKLEHQEIHTRNQRAKRGRMKCERKRNCNKNANSVTFISFFFLFNFQAAVCGLLWNYVILFSIASDKFRTICLKVTKWCLWALLKNMKKICCCACSQTAGSWHVANRRELAGRKNRRTVKTKGISQDPPANEYYTFAALGNVTQYMYLSSNLTSLFKTMRELKPKPDNYVAVYWACDKIFATTASNSLQLTHHKYFVSELSNVIRRKPWPVLFLIFEIQWSSASSVNYATTWQIRDTYYPLGPSHAHGLLQWLRA